MAVRIRLTRYGKKNRSYSRVAVFDSRSRRDGRYLECLGGYDPLVKDPAKKLTVNVERLQHWVRHGARPTPNLEKILEHCGVSLQSPPPAKAAPVKPSAKK